MSRLSMVNIGFLNRGKLSMHNCTMINMLVVKDSSGEMDLADTIFLQK